MGLGVRGLRITGPVGGLQSSTELLVSRHGYGRKGQALAMQVRTSAIIVNITDCLQEMVV